MGQNREGLVIESDQWRFVDWVRAVQCSGGLVIESQQWMFSDWVTTVDV